MSFKNFFAGKKITVMGLGLLGRGVGDVKFLAECGADLIVTDLKSKEELAPSLDELESFTKSLKLKAISYHLGGHRLEDFRNRDFILKSAGVPLDSPYITEARKNKIPVEMSASLFAKLSPATIIGVTGTRGKTTTAYVIDEILKYNYQGLSLGGNPRKALGKIKVFLGGNIKGVANLPLLEEAKKGDFVVMELDSWQLQGFGPAPLELRRAGESGISPHVSIFTTLLPDHLNYYKGDTEKYLADKANIFLYQKPEDFLIIGSQAAEKIFEKYGKEIRSKIIVADEKSLPQDLKIKIPGEHNRYNISLAVEAAKILEIPDSIIKKAVENFKGVPGRLEFVKNYKGIKIYNDTTSTTPDATLAGLKALSYLGVGHPSERKIVLIMGGADKQLDMTKLVEALPEYCKAVVLLPGTGTEKIRFKNQDLRFNKTENLKEAVDLALKECEKGDVLLFSPSFASFGLFKNEYDRGEQFMYIIKKLK